MDLVIVTAPYPPGSRTLISPSFAVFEIAPAKVLHGAVRLHGFTSSPTPDTQVRIDCAVAGAAQNEAAANAARPVAVTRLIFVMLAPRLMFSLRSLSRFSRHTTRHSALKAD